VDNCAGCRQPLPRRPQGAGRRRIYCSPACRQRAYRARGGRASGNSRRGASTPSCGQNQPLALMVCTDRRVRRRFRDHVYLVTMGRDVRGAAAVAATVNDVIKLVEGEDATFTDPDLAGARLGALLDTGPRRLLVLDDVWAPEQLASFTRGGRRWVGRPEGWHPQPGGPGPTVAPDSADARPGSPAA
jgi:hypothetical protein